MSLIYIIFVVFIMFFVILFVVVIIFANFIKRIVNKIYSFIFSNSEECPLCHSRHSMKTIKTPMGHKKICHKCGFSVETDD